jgi:hypothetical protein
MFKFVKAAFKMPNVIEAVISGGDKIVFTKEERMDMIIETAKVLGPQTIARRIMSFVIAGTWCALTIMTAILLMISMFTDLIDPVGMTQWNRFYFEVLVLFGGVAAFYFGTGAIRARKK